MLAKRIDTPGCLRNYHGHCNYPGNGRQSVENVDPNIPAKRKTAKRLRRIIVSSVIGILGLCVQCVCVCVGGGGGRGKVMYKSERRGKWIGGVNHASKLEPTMMEQMRAGTRRSIPKSPPKQKHRKNPTKVRAR